MPMEEALVARLSAAAGTSAVLARNDDGGRSVSWFGRPRGDALPGTVLSKVSPGVEWSHAGPDGLEEPRVQFDHYARDPDAVLALARAMRTEMEQAADVADGLGNTVRFHPAQIEADEMVDEGEQDGGEPLFRIMQDYLFYFEIL